MKKVIIIGGGHSGLRFINVFNKKHSDSGLEVILIDPKDFYDLNFFNLWDLAAPEDLNGKSRILYKDFVKAKFIQGKVKELTENTAILESGGTILYDYAIIASGTSYPRFPYAKSDAHTKEEANKKVKEEYEILKSSSSVLIIGGGGVGVELAGEIKARIPHLNVQLVDMAPTLLSKMNPKAQSAALEGLENLGVKVYLNESVDLANHKGNTYKTGSGKKLSADRVYFTVGPKINTEFLSTNFRNVLNEKGEILIDVNFQVIGTKNLFAIGDAATTKEPKHGIFAFSQAAFLAENFIKLIEGSVVKSYKRKPLIALFPIGNKSGILHMGDRAIIGRLPGKMKHSKMYLNFGRKSVGASKV